VVYTELVNDILALGCRQFAPIVEIALEFLLGEVQSLASFHVGDGPFADLGVQGWNGQMQELRSLFHGQQLV